MTHRSPWLLIFALAACRDVAGPAPQPWMGPPCTALGLGMSLSKTALPSGVSVVVSSTLECEGGRYVFDTGSWATSDSTIVRVTAPAGTSSSRQSGTLATLGPGTATVTVSVGTLSATARVTVLPGLRFASVVGMGGGIFSHACGVTTAETAFCWGNPSEGALGVDTASDDCRDACNAIPRPVAGGLKFKMLVISGFSTCGLTGGGDAYCWGLGYTSTPTQLATGVTLTALSPGISHMCGLAVDGNAYCWGGNSYGQLGDGTRQSSATPVKVTGGIAFTAISAGGNHSCALDAVGRAYCWGSNYVAAGLPPVSLDTAASAVPTPVPGDLAFVSLSAGSEHTCALLADGSAYCWGANEYGQLGFNTDRDTTCGFTGGCSRSPGLVSGGLTFGLMDVTGGLRSCGITTPGQAYCWGGLLKAGTCASAPQGGDGGGWGGYPICIPQPTRVTTPELIPGGTSFATRGGAGECWLGQDGLAYCWGGHEGEAPQRVPGQ